MQYPKANNQREEKADTEFSKYLKIIVYERLPWRPKNK